MSGPLIASFILRFTQESGPSPSSRPWYGVIRHVQSKEEVHFVHVEEALEFIARYVDIAPEGETLVRTDPSTHPATEE